MAKMSQADYLFWTGFVRDQRGFHEKNFLRRIEPDRLLSAYEGLGRRPKSTQNEQGTDSQGFDDNSFDRFDDHAIRRITFNKMFPTTNTIIPQLYPRNPKFVVTPRRNETDELSAKVLASSLDYYFEEIGAVEENQKAILNAWFFGYGVVKQGWRTVFDTPPDSALDDILGIEKPEAQNFEQEGLELPAVDEPYLYSIDPQDFYLDHQKPWGKSRVVTQRIVKTLDELIKSKLYKIDDEFISKFRNKDDDRKVRIELFETWIQQRDGLMVFTHADRWTKPLRWEKMDSVSEGFPFQILRLNPEPRVTYPVSHGRVALRAMRELNYILTLQLKHIDKHRSQTIVDETALTERGKGTLEDNEIGGIVYSKKPVDASVMQNIGNTPVPADLFNVGQLLSNQVEEILTVTGPKVSGSVSKTTATEVKVAESGNQLRSLGMQEAIKTFLVKQGTRMAQDIKQFATAPSLLKITGMNLQDPDSGELITERWLQFPDPQTGENLKDAVQGDYDITIDQTEAMSRDLPVVRAQFREYMTTLAEIEPRLIQQGKQIDWESLMLDGAKNFETISNPQKYIRDAEQAPAIPGMEGAGAGGVPTPESIAGATQVPVPGGNEGLV